MSENPNPGGTSGSGGSGGSGRSGEEEPSLGLSGAGDFAGEPGAPVGSPQSVTGKVEELLAAGATPAEATVLAAKATGFSK